MVIYGCCSELVAVVFNFFYLELERFVYHPSTSNSNRCLVSLSLSFFLCGFLFIYNNLSIECNYYQKKETDSIGCREMLTKKQMHTLYKLRFNAYFFFPFSSWHFQNILFPFVGDRLLQCCHRSHRIQIILHSNDLFSSSPQRFALEFKQKRYIANGFCISISIFIGNVRTESIECARFNHR